MPAHSLLTAAILVLVCLAAALVGQVSGADCARTCHEVDCDAVALRYGKYCGVGHGGCPGEKPCDAVDKCCMGHDACVEKTGVLDNKCHEKFIRCLDRTVARGGKGFSKKCPWSKVVPVMKTGISFAMMFGGLGGDEL